MRDRDRELWSVGGIFISHQETSLQDVFIQKLDQLIYNNNSTKDETFANRLSVNHNKNAEAPLGARNRINKGNSDSYRFAKLHRGTSVSSASFAERRIGKCLNGEEEATARQSLEALHNNDNDSFTSLKCNGGSKQCPESINSLYDAFNNNNTNSHTNNNSPNKVERDGSFYSSNENGSAKLKRHNAYRQKSKISRDNSKNFGNTSGIDSSSSTSQPAPHRGDPTTTFEEREQEWKRLVGSFKRKVQRHASHSHSGTLGTHRKNSLTHAGQATTTPTTASKFELFKREKSREEAADTKFTALIDSGGRHEKKATLSKQRSCEPPTTSTGSTASSSSKARFHPKKKHKEAAAGSSRDDFLQATMRIFLVVSPPVGKLQVRSRSLNHLDRLEMRQGISPTTDPITLKDAKSEPDCTKSQLTSSASFIVPSLQTPTSEAAGFPIATPSTSTSSSFCHHQPQYSQRRHMLSRSQKSSSECFSVNFEVGDESTYETELFFPASRGITLYDSLVKLCELRNIDLSNCDIWLCDRDNHTQTWLSLSQDTACLVGKHLRITNKDLTSRSKLQPKKQHSSGSFRPRTSSFFNSSIDDEKEYDLSKKQTGKQRWSGLFGNNKDTKLSMEQLIEQLNNYSKFGVPNLNQTFTISQSESIEALNKLEDDWKQIINITELNDRQQKQQTALWELIKTEVAYIKTLKVVTDLFLACLQNLQQSNILKEIDTTKLFSNITEILDANIQLWRTTFYPLVKNMRTYKQPPCIELMNDGFIKINDTFQAYYRFCNEHTRCQQYCRENLAHNDLFTAYLAWCETQKECNRLRLMDILVQPMQRLTKYGLLLKAILKNTDDDVERDYLNMMIRSMDEFVNNVNFSLKQKQDNERLKGVIARIESYDVIETKDDDLEKLIRAFNNLDLNKPMINCSIERRRHLLLEGDLKFKDSGSSKMEVHCFLLTDILLVCKPSTKKGSSGAMKVIRQPFLVDRLVVSEINKETPTLGCIYKNEFDMAVAAFLLQNTDAKKLKAWKEAIEKAQQLYCQAKQASHIEESYDAEFEYAIDNDFHCLQLAPRSPLASSSRASRVSSLAHSHSGSIEMNDQSSLGSTKDPSRTVSMENENRTASISSDEGGQSLPNDKSPIIPKHSFKHRLLNKTPNTLSVQPYTHNLGQSLPNLVLGSPNTNQNLSQHTLSVPSTSKNGHLLSPTHRGISYPPPSPTRGNLRRGLAITQNKNPPLIKTRHVTSTTCAGSSSGLGGQMPASFDFDVPVIAGISSGSVDQYENFKRGQHRQAMLKRIYRNDNKRFHTAGVIDDIKKNELKDATIQKRLSWNFNSTQMQGNETGDRCT